jgi:hypothetical protein
VAAARQGPLRSSFSGLVQYRFHIDDRRHVQYSPKSGPGSAVLCGDNPGCGTGRRGWGGPESECRRPQGSGSRGRMTSTSRTARSSQVGTMISVPAARSRISSLTAGFEDEPGIRRALVLLPRRMRPVRQWGLDPSDRYDLIAPSWSPPPPMSGRARRPPGHVIADTLMHPALRSTRQTPSSSCWPVSGCRGSSGGHVWRHSSSGLIRPDVIAVGICHDRIARTPERVERRLPPR